MRDKLVETLQKGEVATLRYYASRHQRNVEETQQRIDVSTTLRIYASAM